MQSTPLARTRGMSSRLPYAQQGLGSSLQLIEHQVVGTKSLLSWPLLPALKGAPMDVKFQSEIGTPHSMIEAMNHIKVLLKSTGRSEYLLFQDDECVSARRVYLLVKSWARFNQMIYIEQIGFAQLNLSSDHI